MTCLRQILVAVAVFSSATASAGQIGIVDFSGGETVTSFDNLGLGFTTATPLVFDGNTYTTDDGILRYTDPNTFDADCNGECIGNDSDLGWIDVVLGGAYDRVGARVGGADTSYNGLVDFFGVGDVLLGTVAFGNNAGMVFAGWEDFGGITRVRFNDTASNGRIVHLDDFRFENVRVPEPGSLAMFGLGLAGLVVARRRKAA
jgi:hypothetical protein